ncbi:hypothetical protein BH09BAC4_BH09BAC4_08190 [soil metagenome]
MNLFANLNNVLSSDVMSRIATYIDEPAEKTSKAVNGLVYTIIGGLMKRTMSDIGVNQLYSHIQKGRYDGTLTDNPGNILRDPSQTNTLIMQGNDVISHLLPAMKSSISNMISTYAGIRNSSSISLLGLTTTIVLQVLGKQVKDQKLDAEGLASMLFSERDAFISAVPDDFMPRLVDKVGLQQIVTGQAAQTRRPTVDSPTRSTAPPTRQITSYDLTDDSDNENAALTKWGFGALIALALAIGGYYIYQNTQKYSDEHKDSSDVSTIAGDSIQADTVTRSLAVPKDPAAKTAGSATAVTPPTTATVAGGLTQLMTPYLTNPALPKGRVFTMTGVAFLPGSLSLTPGSVAAIGELTTLLKAYPQLQIQLVGYANDAQGGFTNKNLSFKRVYQVKQQLMTAGINFLRVDAIGRGTGVYRRDTSAIPRPTLRKIDVKVVAK